MKNEELENHKQNLNFSLLISHLSLKNSAVKQSDFLWRRVRGDCVKKSCQWQVFSIKREQLVAVRVDRPNPLCVESRPKIKNKPNQNTWCSI